jgi:hypothetical protein
MSETSLATHTLRCAPWARDEGVSPIGTAGSYAGLLLVEWPLPWPHDISEIEALAPLKDALRDAGVRMQALVPIGERQQRRVALYRASSLPDGFREYQCIDRLAEPSDVVSTALALLRRPSPSATSSASEVLVCTHGKRDVCCGSLGTSLAMELAAAPALFGDAPIWRTSHTGGHRFAPTAIVLPEGTVWAFLDAETLRRIVHREGPISNVINHYRGCLGLSSPPVQAVEQAVLAEIGWDWFDYTRRGELLDDGQVVLTATLPDGEILQWQAEVVVTRMTPVPDCGKPIEMAKKSEPELAVTNLRRL